MRVAEELKGQVTDVLLITGHVGNGSVETRNMAMNVKHYLKDGTEHKSKAMHKHPDGTLMTGKAMSKSAKKLFHYGKLSSTAQKKARNSWG
mgnify:CR=1 FL=1